MTLSGTRQHLTALERDGLVAHSDLRDGRGRPKYLYYLTPMADNLFPRNYVDLTNELLEYVDEADPALLDQIFDKRGQRRLERARQRTAGLAFPAKVAAVTALLDEDGYLAAFEGVPGRLVSHHRAQLRSDGGRPQVRSGVPDGDRIPPRRPARGGNHPHRPHDRRRTCLRIRRTPKGNRTIEPAGNEPPRRIGSGGKRVSNALLPLAVEQCEP